MYFKAEIVAAEGTGAGYGFEPHQYAHCEVIGWGRSPKRAIADATRKIKLPGWMGIYWDLKVTNAKTGKVVYRER